MHGSAERVEAVEIADGHGQEILRPTVDVWNALSDRSKLLLRILYPVEPIADSRHHFPWN